MKVLHPRATKQQQKNYDCTTNIKMKKTIITLFAALPWQAAAFAGQMPDNKVLVLKTKDGLALQAMTPVAYFTRTNREG